MSDDLFEVGSGPAFERLKKFARRAESLPPDVRELVDELLEAYTVSVEELQVAAEELNQQNAELMATREEIEIQRQRYRDMFEFAPDGYLVTDPVGIIREVNQASVDLLGASRNNLLEKPMVLYVAPDERDQYHLQLDQLLKENGGEFFGVEWEMHIKSRQGREFPAALTVAPINNPNGELTGLRWLLRDITPSKRAEERERLLAQVREQNRLAQEANRLLHALIETMPVGAIIADGDGMFLLTNTAGREILGSPVGGKLEAPQIDFQTYYPDGAPFPREKMPLMRSIWEKQPVKDVEVLVRRADGETRNILASAAPILDDDRNVLSGITIFQDITERKKTRKALHRNAENLEMLREIDQAILTAETEREIGETILARIPKMLACLCADLTLFEVGTGEFSVLAAYPPEEPALCEILYEYLADASILAELSRGNVHGVEDVRKIRNLKWVEALQARGVQSFVNIPIIIDENLIGMLNLGMGNLGPLSSEQVILTGRLVSLVTIGFRQVRLWKQLQRHAAQLERTVVRRTGALHESEERFRIILEAAVFGIALLDTKGRIVQSNPALQNMTGYSESELIGMKFSDYSHPEDIEADEELYRALASLETGHFQTKKRYVRKDGQVRWSELTVSRIRQTMGNKPWLAVAVMEDITEKKKFEESLARAEQLAIAGRLGTSLAHEINNPVQAVIGCLGLAEEMLEDNSEVYRYLEIAMQELERTAKIVTQLRDLGRETEAKEKEPTDLNAFIERVLLLTRKRCQNQGVDVEWSPAEGLPLLTLSIERMQQVLLNIILNALEAMPEGGKLRLFTTLTTQPSGVNVAVADSGIGIEPERQVHIFEPFNSGRPDGLGLGLFISKNIIEEHGGRIGVESQVGKGSTFNIWLPA